MTTKPSAPKAAPADPCSLVIFGASGDLTHRLLVPALYNLAADGLLAPAFSIVGVARGERSDDAFKTDLAKGLKHFATGPSFSTVPPMSTETRRIRRPIRSSAWRWRAWSGSATPAATGCSISPLRRERSPRSADSSVNRASRVRKTEPGGGSSLKSRLDSILLRRARSIASFSGCWRNSRSIASTTISERRRCKISWYCGSRTGCSNPSGTATTSIMCRSPWPRR